MFRTFVAISVSQSTRRSLVTMQQALAGQGFRARWTFPEQFHVTLKFLGEIDAASVDRLILAVAEAVATRRPFELAFQGAGAFPDWTRPRVLWARVTIGSEALIDLAHEVETAAVQAGFAPSDRPFRPHLTLGRVKRTETKIDGAQTERVLALHRAGPERVERVEVFRSRLTPQGPIYTPLASLMLGERGADAIQ